MSINQYIINIKLLAVAIILPASLFAQKPGGSLGAATPVTTPSPYTHTTINYVRTWEPEAPLKDTNAITSPTRLVREVKQTTEYLDGLGRAIQRVAKGVSPNGRDLVQMFIYDPYGREQYSYLQYTHQASGDGKFKRDPFSAQNSFYKNGILNPGLSGENIFYTKKEIELSPLDRELKMYAPGNSWINRPVETRYLVNGIGDSVRIWTMGSTFPVSTSSYANGQLSKIVSINEHGNQTVEYKDKDSRIILKKIQISDVPSTGAFGWLCTYYVYDDMGNLRYVIPPSGVEAIKGNWTITAAVDTGLCYHYQYDARQRMIVKRAPGAGRTLLVYDSRDRVVFAQDSIQRSKVPMEWIATFYDDLNRPTMTAIYKNTISLEDLQKSVDAAVASATISYVAPAKADLAVYEHDGRSLYTATNSITVFEDFDSGNGEMVMETKPSTGDTISLLANNPLPNISPSLLTPLAYTF